MSNSRKKSRGTQKKKSNTEEVVHKQAQTRKSPLKFFLTQISNFANNTTPQNITIALSLPRSGHTGAHLTLFCLQRALDRRNSQAETLALTISLHTNVQNGNGSEREQERDPASDFKPLLKVLTLFVKTLKNLCAEMKGHCGTTKASAR